MINYKNIMIVTLDKKSVLYSTEAMDLVLLTVIGKKD